MTTPAGALVSVLVPVRDEARYIQACLESVMACNPGPGMRGIEVIVVNDHSHDDTIAAIAQQGRDGTRWPVKVLDNPGVGKAAALNHAFGAATGDVFVLLGGDDLVVPEAFAQRTAPLLAAEPQVVACLYRTLSEDPAMDGAVLPRNIQADHIAGGATSFNRAFAAHYFPIPESLPNEDTWLKAVILHMGLTVQRLSEVGLLYRLHARNTMGQDRSFDQVSEALRQRHEAYRLVLQMQPPALPAARRRLEALCRAERHRAAGRWYAIPFIRGLSRGDMVTCIVNSRKSIYDLKKTAMRLRGAWRH